jgi:hypothetical protein
MRPQLLVVLVSFLRLAWAFAINPRSNVQDLAPAQAHLIHQFPKPTWVENIAIRKNGQLLVSIVTAPDLYLIDPLTSALNPTSANTATLVHSFAPNFTTVLGITEVQPDHFYVIAGNLSLSPLSEGLGTYTVWSVDLQTYNPTLNAGAVVKEIAALTTAGLLNGMSTLDALKGLVVLADSVEGAIWLVDVNTGDYSKLLQEPEMAPPAGQILGINGIRVLPPSGDTAYIYFDNQGAATFYRVPISLSTLQKTGPVETLASNVTIDDFALDEENKKAYLAGSAVNSLLKISLNGGNVETVYGGLNETVLAGPTSVAVGKSWGEKGKLFVTTNGGFLAPVNGYFQEGGKVVAVDIDC